MTADRLAMVREPGRPTVHDAILPAQLSQLDRPTCVTLLTTQHVGRLVVGAEPPHIRVVNYTAFEHAIMFRSDPGPALDVVLRAPVVFEVDMYDECTRSGWSVTVRGMARDVSDNLAGLGQSGGNVDTWAPGPKNRWIALAMDDVSGCLLRGDAT